MGIVYRAHDTVLHRSLAVKILLEVHCGRPDLERRFLEEAQVLGQLQHPAIPPVHALGRLPDGRPYFAMKLVKGHTLSDLLAARANRAEDQARFLGIFEQVCQALAYAHSKGVIHRDLKPANVMVGAFGEVQVMDWGLAKVLGAKEKESAEVSAVVTTRAEEPGLSTQVGAVMGTYAYMPPEQACGEVDLLDARADVFGLGAMLCAILTGQPPYSGTAKQVKWQSRSGELKGAHSRLAASEADAELLTLAKECLAGEREARPTDARKVAERVAAYRAAVQERLQAAELFRTMVPVLSRAAAQARAEQAQATARAELRARRLLAGSAAAALVAVGLAAALVGALVDQARTLRRGVEADLEETARLREQARFAEARAVLARAEARLPGGKPADLAERLQEATLLLQSREQSLALDQKLPAHLDEAAPANNAERLALAQLCQKPTTLLYVAAARFYADAFAAEPKLAEDPQNGHRYSSACAAAMAGCGQGKDAGLLDEKDRVRLRRQALTWLRADLDAWAKLLDGATPEQRTQIIGGIEALARSQRACRRARRGRPGQAAGGGAANVDEAVGRRGRLVQEGAVGAGEGRAGGEQVEVTACCRKSPSPADCPRLPRWGLYGCSQVQSSITEVPRSPKGGVPPHTMRLTARTTSVPGGPMNDRVRELLAEFDPTVPLDWARTIPAKWYFDPALYALERQAVFGNSWQVVGCAGSVAEPGSFLTAEIAGEPILVVSDAEGVLRAFSNVCRHRAAPVMTQPEGKASRLRCRYHGWTYDLTGRLRGTPEFDGVADFCREDQGLPGLTVASWGPLVWVHLGEQPPPLSQFLSPLPERLTDSEMGKLRFVGRREYVLACNWKVYVDNFLDGGYHVNTVHPGLAGVLDYTHYRTEIAGNTSVQISPLRPADGQDPAGMASVRTGSVAQYWWIYPNFMLNLYDGVMDTNLVLPLGQDRCRVIFDFYFARTEGTEAEQFIKQSIAAAEQIQQEDVDICEEVQRGLGSRSFATGRFSVKREAGGYHFHQLLARQLQAAAVGPQRP
jgi:choline monooxygenase